MTVDKDNFLSIGDGSTEGERVVTTVQKGRGVERGYFVTAACATCIIIFITRFDPRKREKAGKWTWRGRRNPSDVMRSRISR